MLVIGIEISEGVSRKTGKPYAVGTLHTMTPLAPPMGAGNVALGSAGDKFECPVELLRKVQHLQFPVHADVEVQSVIRFGERQQMVVDVKPLALAASKA